MNINPTPRRSNRSVSTDTLSTLLNGKRDHNESNSKNNNKKTKRK
jgi:hypothetical protein